LAEDVIYIRESYINILPSVHLTMFRYKSAGIMERMSNAVSFEAPHLRLGRPWESRNGASRNPQGLLAKDETYIAAAQLTVASMPFFRWSQ